MAHTVVDDIHEPQLFALAAGSSVILADGHCLGLLLPVRGLEHRKRKFHADLIVALAQFLELLLCEVEFPSGIEVDGVDEEVRMDVFPVCVGADQNFIALIVLGQLQRRRMSSDRVDRFAFGEALYHVVEHDTVSFVAEPLGGHEVCIDAFRLTVDTRDQFCSFPYSFLVLHGVAHHSAHATAGLTALVVGKADNGHSSPMLSFQDHPDSSAEFRECLVYTVQIDCGHSSHVRQGDELVQISADGLQFFSTSFSPSMTTTCFPKQQAVT